jgi:hypothetical protein
MTLYFHCKKLIFIAMKIKSLHNKRFYCHKNHILPWGVFFEKTNPTGPINSLSGPMSCLILGAMRPNKIKCISALLAKGASSFDLRS